MRCLNGAEKIGFEDDAEDADVGGGDVLWLWSGDAGVIYQDIEGADLCLDCLCSSLDGGFICDVDRDKFDVSQSGGLQSFYRILSQGFVTAAEEYLIAEMHHLSGCFKTDAFVGAGDKYGSHEL